MLNFLNTQQSHADYSTSAMEADTISKNGRNPKSHKSRGDESIKNYELRITRFFCCFFVCLFFIGAFSTYAQESKLKIAVIDIGYKELTSILTTELVNTKKYIVMERSKVQQIINELGLQSEQNVSARAAEIGNLLGVHKIITGEFLWSGSVAKASLRLIDVESGSIEVAVTMDDLVRKTNGKIKKKGGWAVHLSSEEFAQKLLDALLN